MKSKIKTKYQEMIFLFVYMRHLEMSLDRTRWDGFGELRKYYQTVLAPSEVLKWPLLQSVNCDQLDKDIGTLIPKEYSRWQKFTAKLLPTFDQYFIDKDDLLSCLIILKEFDSHLQGSDLDYTANHESLRQCIVSLAYGRLKYNMKSNDLDRAFSIEHYLQAEHLEHTSLRDYWNLALG